MRIVIYESSAHGGNFNYAVEIFKAYAQNERVKSASLLVPTNAIAIKDSTPILLRDKIQGPKFVQRIYFLWRTFVNPFVLFFYLIDKKKSYVILNDFEQLTAPLWSLIYKFFFRRHSFSVFLHDPDRDNYPPSKGYTNFSMKAMMSLMKFGFYHEHLPDRPYYQNVRTKLVSVPHGIYSLPTCDKKFHDELTVFKKNSFMLAIIGNIRQEKNYEMAIRCLTSSPDLTLLIAGNVANSSVNIEVWKQFAAELGVHDRIRWSVRYLSESELAAAIKTCDCILLNYASTFTSQSGILNMLAPFKKRVIISSTESGLTTIAKRFELGELIPPDSQQDLDNAVLKLMSSNESFDEGWEKFRDQASWQNHVEIVLKAFGEK